MVNLFLINGKKEECNGCGACALLCPVDAIDMKEDVEGFLYPEIDDTKCIKCGKCKETCSNYNDSKKNGVVYAAINKNKMDLANSSSGGMFFLLAKYAIEKKGVVFGVELDENLMVKHNYAEKIEDCKRFHGSKYVRSDISGIYQKVKEFLDYDRYVLFTGTPCQCQGLRTYLNKNYNKLLLCDIICHSNPSPKVYREFIKNLEQKYNKKVVNIRFRNKEKGWIYSKTEFTFDDGTEIEDILYKKGFGTGLINRPSCSTCKFAGTERISDFSIGDFWGIEEIINDIDESNGVSLLSVNSEKAKTIFEEIKNNMVVYQSEKDIAYRKNHHSPLKMHEHRRRFFNSINKKPIISNIEKEVKHSLLKRIKYKIRTVLKD